MSQLGSQPSSWVSIPLEKYSYNNSRAGTTRYTWTHISRNDLHFAIRNAPVRDEAGVYTSSVILAVSVGNEQLEFQDLGELAVLYRQHTRTTSGDSPVQVVIRPPVYVAMVYPKHDGTIQRTQFRFSNELDYRRVIEILNDLGLPSRVSPPYRAGASSLPPQSVSPAISTFSAGSSSTLFHTPRSIPGPHSSFPAGQVVIDEASTHQMNNPSLKTPGLPGHSVSTIQQISNSMSGSNSLLVSHPAQSIETSMAVTNAPRYHAGSASIYLSQLNKEEAAYPSKLPLSTYHTSSVHKLSEHAAPSRVEATENDRARADIGIRRTTASPYFSTSANQDSPNAELNSSTTISENDRLNQILANPLGHGLGIQRPASHPVDIRAIQSLSIPPRRELPFSKPSEAKKKRVASLVDLPPLPVPTLVRNESVIRPPVVPAPNVTTPVAKPKKRVVQRKPPVSRIASSTSKQPVVEAPSQVLPKANVLEAPASVQDEEPSPLAVKSAAALSRPASAAGILESKAAPAPRKRAAPIRPASAAKRPKMVDQSTQTKIVTLVDQSVGDSNAPDLIRDAPSPASPPESYLQGIENFISKHNARPRVELWDRPGYADADQEKRDSMLNEFICENLNNADFVKLCEDTEFAWRRAGFGL